MKLHLKVGLSLLLAMLSLSCEKEVHIDIPDPDPEIVFNSVLRADQNFSAYLSWSAPYMVDVSNFDYISNAQIKLYENEVLLETITNNWGTYGGSEATMVKPGSSYKAEVIIDGAVRSWASMTAPHRVPIQVLDIWAEQQTSQSELFDSESPGKGLRIRLQDPLGPNYYCLRAFQVQDTTGSGQEKVPGSVPTEYEQELTSDDPSVDYSISNGNGYGLLFTDDGFDGQQHDLVAYILDWYSSYSEYRLMYRLELSTISPKLYTYLKNTTIQNEYSGDAFAEVITIEGNVVGGYGIFGCISSTSDIVTFDGTNMVK